LTDLQMRRTGLSASAELLVYSVAVGCLCISLLCLCWKLPASLSLFQSRPQTAVSPCRT